MADGTATTISRSASESVSRALIADALERRTSIDEAMRLMSIKSLSTFDEYARRLDRDDIADFCIDTPLGCGPGSAVPPASSTAMSDSR